MIPISVCIIAKNEEKFIAGCLEKLSALTAQNPIEIIVADTGSTDNTVVIARKYTDFVFHFDWIKDFSAARNFSIGKASHEWILVVDCDEYLEDIDWNSLQKLILQHPDGIGMFLRKNPYEIQGTASIMTERVARLFPKSLYHYEGIIHEQAVPKDGTACKYFHIPMTFYHHGYSDSAEKIKKARRNIELLEKDLRVAGPDPYTYFQLGESYVALNDTPKACDYYALALAMDVNPELEYVHSLVESYGYCLLNLKQFETALQFVNIYDVFATRADFVFLMGLIYMNNALFDEAIHEFKKATTISAYAVEGVNSYNAWYNAGVVYECTGRTAEAVNCYRKCGQFTPALSRLKQLT